ncbi:MAG TPA: HAMP domain-containing protein [Actinoplanes sp.]|nr:HAMP domain-containing protein [Actinoplanes sp.]
MPARRRPRPRRQDSRGLEPAEVERLLSALTAMRDGDFGVRLRVPGEADGPMARLATVVNEVVERNRHLTGELDRVRRVVGRDGRLDERLRPGTGTGAWAGAVTAANDLVDELVRPTVEVGRVLGAVAAGDLTQTIDLRTGDQRLRGEFLRMARTVNGMVAQLRDFADEVSRVAREVGTDGKLGGQARVRGVSGTWKDLTDNVNSMANNLTGQVRDIAAVTTAVANGDLSRTVTVDVAGEMLELKVTVNRMVGQLRDFADEVTRLAREVGTEGKLGGQATVPGVAGTWKDLTDNVNSMAGNLTAQLRDIAQVTTAVARGDLSRKITVDVAGELLELKTTVNTMVDQLSGFADEVTRVAREVGSEGRLGGQAEVPGASGTWRDLTDSVNFMAGTLTAQVRNIAEVTTAVARGDLTKKIDVDARGEILELKTTINIMVDLLSAFADEVTRVAREVGTEGKLGGQARVRGASGTWLDLTDNVNSMAGNLTSQVRSIAQVATAVARGDLSQKITVEAEGETAALAQTINTMVDTLRAFADEVTRVAREVGTEGILGGQATVPGVAGTWKDLTDNVNSMANNLTSQVRNIAEVTTAVARGDLRRKIDVDARGEILELKTTINIMVDQLSAFADEVTRVAREVGTEGKLGVQAEVEGVSGTWKRLTESVNQLASTLTIQLRAIADVSTGVTRGDLTRKITVDAAGEVAALKDTINQMIATLRETTRTNQEQDWLKSNLARISGLMQGQRDLPAVARLIMSELTAVVGAQCGAFFLAEAAESADVTDVTDVTVVAELTELTVADVADPDGRAQLRRIASYGYPPGGAERFAYGETLVGQAAAEGKRIHLTSVPAGYVQISSSLGGAPPAEIVVLPVLFEDRLLAVIELATFSPYGDVHLAFLDQITETIGVTVNTIIANSRTEELLIQSRRLTDELQERSEQLQRQQEKLRNSNTELEEKAALLAENNRSIEVKNNEIEEAGRALAERAEQLTLSSRYKSEFLANMSHELRTPLNSLLILARLLSDNPSGNLTPEQVKYAAVIHGAGSDLLQLIDDILDLSKVEAGKMDSSPTEVSLASLLDYVANLCGPLTADKGLGFRVDVDERVPASLHTDERRLQQILRNLLSNAVKFTEVGEVRLVVTLADRNRFQHLGLRRGPSVVAFQVSDTGIGIPADKLKIIFEAFQQADGTTSRRYGGTGLGLSISRSIAHLLGGEIHAESNVGRGSTFTLYLPTRRGTPTAGRAASYLAAKPVDAPRERAATVSDGALTGKRVLIVDDDVRNVFALASVLELNGLEVCYADNGDGALAALGGSPPVDAVLMDVMMPGMDGNEAMAAIRSRPEHADLPIIAVTAKAMQGDRERSLAAGASDYVTKPVDTDHLLGLLRHHLLHPADLEESAASRGVSPTTSSRSAEPAEPAERVERVEREEG